MKYTLLLSFVLILSCQGKKEQTMTHKYTNNLINESSPYLLQHAHNPVNWNPWNDSALSLAKKENKLIIISVGYAACHWCHVMEHESFEDEEVAQLMNSNFVNIKVDREERPDIDQVYMNAVQLMTGQGGWPMNVIALPDGRPIWGGTYFKKEEWKSSLEQISKLYKENPAKLYEYADKLEQGIKSIDIVSHNEEAPNFELKLIDETVNKWSSQFDHNKGGMTRAPKFMMPNNYHFLLRYAYQTNNKGLEDYVHLTLTKIAFGGVYDQLGGGFSRYSVDDKWHVPHFEKMLYDNAQLVSLYADAYAITKNELYKNVIIETLDFVEQELIGDKGNFYSSLDADSDNKEGKLEEGAYYVWQKEELKTRLGTDFDLFSDYYNVNNYGFWEHKNYVLIRNEEDHLFISKHNLTKEAFIKKKNEWKTALLKLRDQRPKPRLDDKTLTSWNALMIKGYVDAYRVLGNKKYLDIAIKNAEFILTNQLSSEGFLFHNYKDDKSTINGYLEDYAATIEAFIALYEQTSNVKWLNTSRDLTNYAFDHFYDDKSRLFFFTNNNDAALVSRNIEYRDNVIPASNSIMAKNLFKLAHFFNNDHFLNTSSAMLNNVKPEIAEYGSGFSNWLDLMLNYTNPFYEIAIAGKESDKKVLEINKFYLPNKILAASAKENSVPLLENRHNDDETLIYVCVNHTCQLPVRNVSEALKFIKK